MLAASIASKMLSDWVTVPSQDSVSEAKVPARAIKQSRGTSRGGKGTGSGQYVNRQDLKIKPPSTRIPSGVPRNFLSQITYDSVKIRSVITASTTALVETNYTFSLNAHPLVSSWTTLFDQWCIPMVSVTFLPGFGPGNTTTVEIHTAIDFDSAVALGSLQQIDNFDNVQVHMLAPGETKSVTRSCRPCLKQTAGTQASSTLNRVWCDSANPTVSWYGIRSIVAIASSAVPITVETTYWYAFRGRY
jgi:hypothetical protein